MRSSNRSRRLLWLSSFALGAGALLTSAAGCNGDEVQKAFRSAAVGSIGTGAVSTISGIIDGAFAAWNSSASSSTDPNAASSGG